MSGLTRILRIFALWLTPVWAATVTLGQVQIVEWVTRNDRGLADEEGDHPDWIELQNLSSTVVQLEGWKLSADSASTPPWSLGATNLAPGARFVIFASGKNRRTAGRPFHTDFRLDSRGDRLRLWLPDGQTLSDDVAVQAGPADTSQGVGRVIQSTPLVATNSAARIRVPTSADAGASWMGASDLYDDSSWQVVSGGVGYDRSPPGGDGLLAFWDFDQVTSLNVATDRTAGAHQGQLVRATYTSPGQGRSGRPNDRALSFNGNGVMSVPDAVTGAFDTVVTRNAVTISLWIRGSAAQPSNDSIFWAGSEPDGGGIRSLNAHLPWGDSVIYWDTAGCCEPALHRVSVHEPDSTQWKGRWNHFIFLKNGPIKQIWENGRLLLEGTNTEPFNRIRSFLVGASNPSGGGGYHGLIDEFAVWNTALRPGQITALAAGASPLDLRELSPFIQTDLGEALYGINASAWLRIPFSVADPNAFDFLVLRLRFDDGFVAYLNGLEVARRNAPNLLPFNASATEARPAGSASEAVEFEFPPAGQLRPGRNWLAIHALNHHADDPSFLVQTELLGGHTQRGRVFAEPTPGEPNGTGATGFVADTHFSVDRGLFTEAFDLQLSVATPGATLVYTLDGSEPSLTNGVITPATNVTLRIASTTVLRAAAFKEDFVPSDIDTQSYVFPAQVAAQRRPAGIGTTWPSGHPTDFLIDARVVNSAQPGYSFTNALAAIPTLSITTPHAGLFGASQGIYPNSGNHGDDWERSASAEWIPPGDKRGFQHNVGLRIHGGISRDKGFTPKHGFTLAFRASHGPSTLEFPIFADGPPGGFNRLVLRAGSTDTWPCVEWDQFVDGEKRWYRKDSSYVRDQWVRDAQLALGQLSSHGTFAHLYLNGLYWGLYNVCERPDADFGALYLGGKDTEYDAIADYAEIHAGNADAWNQLMNLASTDLSVAANYQRLLGRNADGTRNPNLEVLLDVENLVDYMLLHIFVTADDWPPHNWWAGRRRGPLSTGFKFFAWDQEISNNSVRKEHNSYGQLVTEVGDFNTPAYVYARCRANADFRMLFGDRIQKHLFNNGALTESNCLTRWHRRIAEIDSAIVAESARWGDHQRASKPYLREIEWLTNVNWMRNVFFPTNTQRVLRRLRSAKLFPTLNAPVFSQFGGLVPPGYALEIRPTNSTGTIYYTTDGTDPRRLGGAVGASAQVYSEPLPLSGHTHIRARLRNGTTWSAVSAAEFFVAADYTALQPTEVHYHPTAIDGGDGEALEFLELTNTGTNVLELDGLEFSVGIDYAFPSEGILRPGATYLLVRDPVSFRARFPGARVDGAFAGRLENAGETLTLRHNAGFEVFSLTYDDHAPWPAAADGTGLSLQRFRSGATPNDATQWFAAEPTPGIPPNWASEDTDADGLPDSWERAYGTDPLVKDAEADPDDDGLSNRAEFLAGTLPNDPGSVPLLRLHRTGPHEFDLRFLAISNRLHVLQRRVAPKGSWELWRQFEPEPATRDITVTAPADSDTDRWYRLLITFPEH